MPFPYCTLTGRVFSGGTSGVAMLSPHPRCRIPALVSGAPSISTDRGWLRPERSLVYNEPALLLHHAAATRPGRHLDDAALAAFARTATRLLAIVNRHLWAGVTPLEFTATDQLVFSCCNNALLLDLVLLKRQLSASEQLNLDTLDGSTFLIYSR